MLREFGLKREKAKRPDGQEPEKEEAEKADLPNGQEPEKEAAKKTGLGNEDAKKADPEMTEEEKTVSLEETVKAAQKPEETKEAAYPEIIVKAKVIFSAAGILLKRGFIWMEMRLSGATTGRRKK